MTNSTFWTDGYRDAEAGNAYSPPEHSATSVYTAEYQRGYNAFYDERTAKPAIKTISRKEWQDAGKHGYASKTISRNGHRMILALDKKTQATILQEVIVEGMREPPCY